MEILGLILTALGLAITAHQYIYANRNYKRHIADLELEKKQLVARTVFLFSLALIVIFLIAVSRKAVQG
jgi:hypothetical protein